MRPRVLLCILLAALPLLLLLELCDAAQPTSSEHIRSKCTPLSPKQLQRAEQAARQWAPLVWLAPGEHFFPSSALDFLAHTRLRGGPKDAVAPARGSSKNAVTSALPDDASVAARLARQSPPLNETQLPSGAESRNKFLETIEDLDSLLANTSSFIYGHSPHFFSVPVYAVISSCCPRNTIRRAAPRHVSQTANKNKNNKKQPDHKSDESKLEKSQNDVFKINSIIPDSKEEVWGGGDAGDDKTEGERGEEFEVTFWLFFPYSEGKKVCTVTAGALGPLPFPWLRTACLGSVKKYGNHVGDWEHVTLAFKGSGAPTAMYVSTHDAGALYSPPHWTRAAAAAGDYGERASRLWTYSGHELRRGGRLQSPRFPRRAVALRSGRPVLFAARGSHGLWTLPGKHKYVTFPNLEDETGFGTSWRTWQNLQVIPWPPPTRVDQPGWLRFEGHWGNPRTGCHPLSDKVCHVTDGPGGIPTKKHAFRCLHNLPQLSAPVQQFSAAANYINRIQ